ncbi:MAG: DNA phosphorothioation-dependent restriction protein DptF [Clostridiaceae bacterium]
MEDNIFSFLSKYNVSLFDLAYELDKVLFNDPQSAVVKGRLFVEIVTKEIAKFEGLEDLNKLNQAERLKVLNKNEIIDNDIEKAFDFIRRIGNKAAHEKIEGDLEAALAVHRNIYKIASWYIENYIDYKFISLPYKTPKPDVESVQISQLESFFGKFKQLFTSGTTKKEVEKEDVKVNEDIIGLSSQEELCEVYNIEEETEKFKSEPFENENDIVNNVEVSINEIVDEELDILDEEISAYDNADQEINKEKKMSNGCLIEVLARLKESSREAVESLNSFSNFKQYMHIERHVEGELEDLIRKANEKSEAQLVLVCGGVGDGKSHLISYLKNKHPEIDDNFTLHNDATESLEPSKTSMDTLNDKLDNFSDEKIGTSTEKFILAINLGTLNNFIDSQYGERYSKLKGFVEEKKILESAIVDNSFDSNSSFQFINFSDYHLYTLLDGKAKSDYIRTLITRVTNNTENNVFYNSYKNNCLDCENCDYCPIKLNYELLTKEIVQESIVQLLIESIIKNKIIISTRALLNFIYDILVARSYLDVNSPMFKEKIKKLNNKDFIKSLTPNIIFNHKELSFIFESLYTLDPLNIRNMQLDDFIVGFNNSNNCLSFFDENLDLSKGYLDKLRELDSETTEYKLIKFELLELFIRSFRLCGNSDIFSLKDNIYNDYIRSLYFWNKGDKPNLKTLYSDVKESILKWNGESDTNHINIFLGKNQLKYKISEEIETKADISNLPTSNMNELEKFIPNLKLKFKSEKNNTAYEIEIDFLLYKLLQQIRQGYRPNKKDKNYYIKFVEFINNLMELGSQKEKIIITEKNKEINKKYKLEYNEFDEFVFVEM